MLGGETAPFVGRPPTQSFGYMAKADSKTAFTDAEIQKLNEGKIAYGGSPLEFSRLERERQGTRLWSTADVRRPAGGILGDPSVVLRPQGGREGPGRGGRGGVG